MIIIVIIIGVVFVSSVALLLYELRRIEKLREKEYRQYIKTREKR